MTTQYRVTPGALPRSEDHAAPPTPAGLDVSSGRRESWVLSVLAAGLFTAFVMLLSTGLSPIATLALGASFALIGVDGVHWLRGRYDTFDPRGIVGAFGVHFYVAAPLLHLVWDYWAPLATPSQGWVPALEHSIYLNLVGLLLYRFVLFGSQRAPKAKPRATIDLDTLRVLAWLAATVSFGFFAVFVASQGGPMAYWLTVSDDTTALVGFGWLLLIGEAFPLIALAAVLLGQREKLRRNLALLVLVFAVFVAAQFLVGGLRGSRSNTVWPAIIGLAMIHLVVRPISARRLLALALIGVVFMYGYGFYKTAGRDALDLFSGGTTTAELSRDTGRTFEGLLLGDFGRSDVQALIVSRQVAGTQEPAWGASYVAAISFLTPSSLDELLPASKTDLITDAWFGNGASNAGLRSSRIAGAAGEATLNFGLSGYVLSFAAIGLVVRAASRWFIGRASEADVGSRLVAGSACIICVLAVGSDLDNILWFATKQLLPLFAVIAGARLLSARTVGPPRAKGRLS